MVNKWSNIKQFLGLGPDCLYCGGQVHGVLALCNSCLEQLPCNHACCQRCADPLPGASGVLLCARCLKTPPLFDNVISPFLYLPPISQLVTRFKYQADLAAGYLLASLLARAISSRKVTQPATPQVECLIPVPLHASRLRSRGFNQSRELARLLGKQLQLPVDSQSCQRIRKTASQSGLNTRQRRQNIRGAFTVVRPINYTSVAIVDDVLTTGNTASELANVLRQSGVNYIEVWSVCRAEHPGR